MSALVYQAINAVAAELAERGIAKRHRNEEAKYDYRSIDDVLAALAPLLSRHKLCVLPRVLDREATRPARDASHVAVRAAFDLVSAHDGSCHTIESYGEALDEGDKATAKAISAAYKAAMLQAFCIPVGHEDSDAGKLNVDRTSHNRLAVPEPPEGWEAWVGEVIDVANSCDSVEALDRLRNSRRQLLGALQRSCPELYAKAGEAIAARVAGLEGPAEEKPTRTTSRKQRGRDELKGQANAAREPAETT